MNKMLGAATVDRLMHGAYSIVLEGRSQRSPRGQLNARQADAPSAPAQGRNTAPENARDRDLVCSKNRAKCTGWNA
jgi:hypothetical protein